MNYVKHLNSEVKQTLSLRLRVCFSLTVFSALLYTIPVFGQLSDDQNIQIGRKIYHQGILPNGEFMRGIGPKGTVIKGNQATCVSCHRRSALGSSEANFRIPPIVGDILFNERTQKRGGLKHSRITGAGARPAYTEQTLRQAIKQGVGADNRQLNSLMPRFNLPDTEITALIAYLKSLNTNNSPGVGEDYIQIATIVGPKVALAQQDAMITTIQTYFKDYNAQTRGEKNRAKHSPWYKSWHYDSFRKLNLNIWRLHGPSKTWPNQIKNYYLKNPVFAIVNGIGNQNWQPIHDFCEQFKIPCLFPTTELPVVTGSSLYSLYFSAGMTLEARALANRLNTLAKNYPIRILQIHSADDNSFTAAKTLTSILSDTNRIKIITRQVTQQDFATNTLWDQQTNNFHPTILVLWLGANSINKLVTFISTAEQVQQIYFSQSITGDPYSSLPTQLLDKSYLISQLMPKKSRDTHLLRLKHWAKRRNISLEYEKVVANAYFSMTKLSMAIQQIRAYLIRDYLVERFEHMLENNVFHSIYPDFELGPNQRFALKGCYIIGPLSNKTFSKEKYQSFWIVP